MRTRGLRFISRGTRVGFKKKKKKNRKWTEVEIPPEAACSVLNTTIREIWVALSKGPVTEKGVECRVSIDAMEKKKAVLRLGCPRISVITGGKSRIIGVGSRSSVVRLEAHGWKVTGWCIAWPRWSVSRFGLNNSTILIYRLELEGVLLPTTRRRLSLELSRVELWMTGRERCSSGWTYRGVEKEKIGIEREAVGECLKGRGRSRR